MTSIHLLETSEIVGQAIAAAAASSIARDLPIAPLAVREMAQLRDVAIGFEHSST